MKKYIILLSALCTMALSGCYKEDPIHVELEKYWRNYDVNSIDPAYKLVSQYWAKYDKVLLYDSQVRDYVYNFQSKNNVTIINPTTKIHEKLQLLDDLILNLYPDEMKKTFFPFNVILAEDIKTPSSKEFFMATNFIAFRITDADLELDEAALKAKLIRINKEFILNYTIAFNRPGVDPLFYEVSKDYYDVGWFGPSSNRQMTIEDAYKVGMLHVSSSPDWNNPAIFNNSYGAPSDDAKRYYELLTTKTDQEITDLREEWPLIDQKVAFFIESLELIGINYKDLR